MRQEIVFQFDKDKDTKLKRDRGIGFEDIIKCIHEGRLLDVIPHFNSKKYPNQKIYLVEKGGYVYQVPFVEQNKIIFLKTVFPSRKASKMYLKVKP